MPLIFSFILSFLLTLDAHIEWTTPTQHNFGDILRGHKAVHIFTFKNLTDKPLVIDNVRTDCSCTASDWAAAPVLPKATGQITVSFDSKQMGYFRKKITVWIRGQRKAERLIIEGIVNE